MKYTVFFLFFLVPNFLASMISENLQQILSSKESEFKIINMCDQDVEIWTLTDAGTRIGHGALRNFTKQHDRLSFFVSRAGGLYAQMLILPDPGVYELRLKAEKEFVLKKKESAKKESKSKDATE